MKKIILIATSLVLSNFLWAEKITVSVNPGESYSKRAPQIAVWIEDADGNYIDTIYATKKAAEKKWIMAPKSGRPESLPDWYKNKSDEVDVVSFATPKKGIVAEKNIILRKGNSYTIKCQANQSFDYNDYYTKENSGVDGQPAVLYMGVITTDGTSKEIKLDLITSRKNITTADKILDSIYAVIE